MSMRLVRWAVVIAFGLAPVWGFPRASAAEPPGGGAERAAKLFEEGAAEYRAGRFDRAIELLGQAYDLAGEPVLLFNLAKEYEGKGDLDKAIDAYERYLRDAKDITDRGAIEARVETLRGQLAARSALEKKAAAERERAERAERDKERSPSPIPWIIAGAGVTGLVTGAALGAFAAGREDDAAAEPVQRDAAELRDEGERLALGANIAFAVGGALLAGGVTWGIVDVVLATRDETSVALRVGPTFVGLRGVFD